MSDNVVSLSKINLTFEKVVHPEHGPAYQVVVNGTNVPVFITNDLLELGIPVEFMVGRVTIPQP